MTVAPDELEPTKGARTRQAILDIAVRQLAVAGLRGTSVPAVAREAGLSASAVYAYFPTKLRLFEAAVDADVAGLVAEALPDVLEGRFDRDFAGVFARLLAALDHHPLARRILAGVEGSGAERLAMLPTEVQLRVGLATAIRRGQADGTVRADVDPDALASGLEAVVIALLIAILQTGGRPDPGYSTGVLTVLDAAMRPAPPERPER
jgi:AcrR family transcriptional regulator